MTTTRQYNHLSIREQREESRRRHEEKFGRRILRCRACRTIVDEQTSLGHLERCLMDTPEAREELTRRYFEDYVLAPRREPLALPPVRRRRRSREPTFEEAMSAVAEQPDGDGE